MRFVAVTFVLATAVALAFPAVSKAEENTPVESARELITAAPGEGTGKPWKFSIDGSWFPRSDISDGPGSVGMSEVKAQLGRSFHVNSSLSFTPELTYSLFHLSAADSARLPENLHSITAGLRSDYRVTPKVSLTFLVAPGLASDFEDVTRDDIRVRFGSTVRYTLSGKLTLLGGFMYQQGYESLPLLPVIGAIYRPDDTWTISIAAPRPGVSYAPGKDLRINLGAEMSGGEYQLHERSLGAKVIRYRDFRVVGGAEFRVTAQLKAEITGGYAFDRQFKFYDTFDPARGNLTVEPGPFARAGLKMEW